MSLNISSNDNSGGSPTLTHRETETRAFSEYAKAALGIATDSIDLSFVEINPRYTTGSQGGLSYETTPGRPLLDHPIDTLHLSDNASTQGDDEWQASYDELLKMLPQEMQEQLALYKQLPQGDRSYEYGALEDQLEGYAKLLTKLKELSQPLELGSLAEVRSTVNLFMPLLSLKGALSTSTDTLTASSTLLQQAGANYRNFDSIQSVASELPQLLSQLKGIGDALHSIYLTANDKGTTGSGRDEANRDNASLAPLDLQQQAAKLADSVSLLQTQLQKNRAGSDFSLLDSQLSALKLVAQALSLPSQGLGSELIGIDMALKGSGQDESGLGFSGKSWLDSMNALSSLLSQVLVNKEGQPLSSAANRLLEALSILAMALTSGGAAASASPANDRASLSQRMDHDFEDSLQFKLQQEKKPFALTLALEVALQSDILPSFLRGLFSSLGASEASSAAAADVMGQLLHLNAMLSAAAAFSKEPDFFIDGHAERLSGGISQGMDLALNHPSEKSKELAVMIGQLAKSLTQVPCDNVRAAIGDLLSLADISYDSWQGDLHALTESISQVNSRINTPTDNHFTSIVNIA